MFPSSIFLLIISLTIVDSFPCPRECICKPTGMIDMEFKRISYLIDCSNISLNNDQLVYQAEQWSINVDKLDRDDDDSDEDGYSTNDYVISIDLSNSLSLKKFTNKTIQLTGFSFFIQNLSLSNQANKITLNPNSFYSSIYENLQILNLSSCCEQIPKQCQQLFRPLNKLEILDLSGSDMYKTCLNTPDTISSTVRDLLLRNNIYDANTFSNSSRLFDGVRTITGKLDLQNSSFQMDKKVEGNCLFDVFPFITALDLSSIRFESKSNNTETHLTRLLTCEQQNGQQLLYLYLRNLKLQRLPSWLTNDSFPLLQQLDLSNNNIASIDISTFTDLVQISLAYNPIHLKNITWRQETTYASINLRSTIRSSTVNLSRRLKNLLKLSLDIDYSENEGEIPANITNIPVAIDFPTGQFALKISRANIYSFEINFNDLRQLDISSNSLTELDLTDEIKLNYLDCSNQSLKKLILSEQLSELNELKCSNNSLTTIINFASLKLEQLKSIDLSYNLIKSLEDLFLNLHSRVLRRINLKSNLIESIPSNMFHEKLISLYEINLSWNRIDKIENLAFQAPNLQILDLTGNSLKIVEPKAIFTASLRLFFVFNDTQQLTNRCARSKSNDNLILMYANWFQTNGTLMKDNKIEFNKCINRYVNQTKKLDAIITKGKHFFGFYSLSITLAASLIGILFVGTYFYRKNNFTFLTPFRRYKKLDRHSLVENAAEMDQQQREDDEIVMNLESPPFNKLSLGPTNV